MEVPQRTEGRDIEERFVLNHLKLTTGGGQFDRTLAYFGRFYEIILSATRSCTVFYVTHSKK
jgi:hypothetical protein